MKISHVEVFVARQIFFLISGILHDFKVLSGHNSSFLINHGDPENHN